MSSLYIAMVKFLRKIPWSASRSGLPPKSNRLVCGLCLSIPQNFKNEIILLLSIVLIQLLAAKRNKSILLLYLCLLPISFCFCFWVFLSNHVHRQTDRQTDRQTKRHKWQHSQLAEVIIVSSIVTTRFYRPTKNILNHVWKHFVGRENRTIEIGRFTNSDWRFLSADNTSPDKNRSSGSSKIRARALINPSDENRGVGSNLKVSARAPKARGQTRRRRQDVSGEGVPPF